MSLGLFMTGWHPRAVPENEISWEDNGINEDRRFAKPPSMRVTCQADSKHWTAVSKHQLHMCDAEVAQS